MAVRWGKFEGRGIRRIERHWSPPSDAEQLVALAALAAALDGRGANWWLTYGALLGWVRGGRFLPNDNDIDAAIVSPSDEDGMTAILLAVMSAGFVMVQEWVGPSGTRHVKLRFGRCYFDLFFVVRRGDYFVDEYPIGGHRGHGRAFAQGTHPAMPVRPMQLGNVVVPVPDDAPRYLAHLYGSDWQIPARSWNWRFSPPNAELFCPPLEWPAMALRLYRWRQGAARRRRAVAASP